MNRMKRVCVAHPPGSKNRVTVDVNDYTDESENSCPHVRISIGLNGNQIGFVTIAKNNHVDVAYLNQHNMMVGMCVAGWKQGLEVLLGEESNHLHEVIMELAK